MGYCPDDCAQQDLVPNPTAGCELKVRKRGLKRVGFYKCTTDLPDVLTCGNLAPLIDDKSIVFSSELANAEFGEPQTDELQISDCRPAEIIVTGRTLTFADKVAVEIPEDVGAGQVENPFGDYTFWKDKKKQKSMLRYLFLFCDGTIEVPKDDDGKPLAANFDVYRAYERQGSGSNSYTLEIKKATIAFKGDPLGFNAPDLNISDCDAINL